MVAVLHTARLRLEPFAEQHLDGLNALNQDPQVMRFFGGKPETREATAAWIAHVQRRWTAWGTGWWAFIEPSSGRIVGAGCIQRARREETPPDDLALLLNNPLEIGWRLHPDVWHQGLAVEAARRMAAFAFDELATAELMACCDIENIASARVMERLGMTYRGVEIWYGEPSTTYVLTRDDWSGH